MCQFGELGNVSFINAEGVPPRFGGLCAEMIRSSLRIGPALFPGAGSLVVVGDGAEKGR